MKWDESGIAVCTFHCVNRSTTSFWAGAFHRVVLPRSHSSGHCTGGTKSIQLGRTCCCTVQPVLWYCPVLCKSLDHIRWEFWEILILVTHEKCRHHVLWWGFIFASQCAFLKTNQVTGPATHIIRRAALVPAKTGWWIRLILLWGAVAFLHFFALTVFRMPVGSSTHSKSTSRLRILGVCRARFV